MDALGARFPGWQGEAAMTEVATRPFPSALPPAENELAAWHALSRDEQVLWYRQALEAPDATSLSELTMGDVLTAARERVAARRG